MAGEEVGVENVDSSFKNVDEEKQKNRKKKAKGDGMTVVMCSRVGNLKMFEGSRVPKVKGRNRNKSTRGLSKIKGETPLPLKRRCGEGKKVREEH